MEIKVFGLPPFSGGLKWRCIYCAEEAQGSKGWCGADHLPSLPEQCDPYGFDTSVTTGNTAVKLTRNRPFSNYNSEHTSIATPTRTTTTTTGNKVSF